MNEIVISVKGLTSEAQAFHFQVDTNFMKSFGELVLSADCKAEIVAAKRGDWIEAKVKIDGSVVVECDRCLDELVLPVAVDEKMAVRFDKNPESVENTDDNVLILHEGETSVDFSQSVYDFICLCIPLQKVHPDGECNPEMLARIGAVEPENRAEDSPFSGLKDLLEKKNN
ncbi:MAG: DUF177 domain-containing protein [Bacteroidales bacterium]|nr:DUF177 domain-containing protein [Bacteroidales bacterium]